MLRHLLAVLFLTALTGTAAVGADAQANKVGKEKTARLLKQLKGLLARQERLRRDNRELEKDVEKMIALLARDDAKASRERQAGMELLRRQLDRLIARELRVREASGAGRKTDRTAVKTAGAAARKQPDDVVAQLRSLLEALEDLAAREALINELRRIDQEQPKIDALLKRLLEQRTKEVLERDGKP
jgi:hypothetical protein